MFPSFHLSFAVQNKKLAKQFYIDILGCPLGRENKTWFDVLFFGHQLTIHQASEKMPAIKMDHFGPILSKAEWLRVSQSCERNNIPFLMPPTVKSKDASDESGKFLILDTGGNTLEFKYYLDSTETIKNKREISVINLIEVPRGMEKEAISIRNIYVEYFKKQKGFVSSTFYRSIHDEDFQKFINIVVWDSIESFNSVVNLGFKNADGKNKDGMNVLGKGFPEPIKVSPSQYELIDYSIHST